MFIIQEQPVHHDVLISSNQIDMNQLESLVQIEEFVNCGKSTSSRSSSDDVLSTYDGESTVMGSPVDRSYTVQDTYMSDMEVSFVTPSYSPIRFSDNDCASPQQTDEVNPTSCSAEEISANQHIATDSIPESIPVSDITISTVTNITGIVIYNIEKNFRPTS